ncbi:hypothetical protein B1992_11860 [Pseudoxanthomonas broegbernensis]|uniref:DUF998 domain-containing protein n=1 Tax=Pseudoxanthomonas broegbernensis TaxID=83619 RepID=A0A7V8K6D7_9GAMM|nr:DUF998 domain-containing protein [Pseudoxanthomonas broegbernensis]KAF1685433.1 hypothetical protein B1992_11860 [Pseudoxanthomonas broegbernensis]MBB6064437.1 hypothetical protein [Pseudoxanthomonas broegbernensis]
MSTGMASRIAAALAPLSFLAAAALGAVAVEGYSHLRHPLALLGAVQAPHPVAFGVFAFALPGLAGAWVAVELRTRLPPLASWLARIGAQLLLLAALAFAAQGALPLDIEGMDAGRSRYHAAAWLLWALAFPAGAALLARGLWRQPGWHRFCVTSLLAALAVVGCGFFASGWIGAALVQRAAFAAWLAWGVCAAAAGRAVSRGAA